MRRFRLSGRKARISRRAPSSRLIQFKRRPDRSTSTGNDHRQGFCRCHEAPQLRRAATRLTAISLSHACSRFHRPASDAGPGIPGQAHVRPHGRHAPHCRKPAGRAESTLERNLLLIQWRGAGCAEGGNVLRQGRSVQSSRTRRPQEFAAVRRPSRAGQEVRRHEAQDFVKLAAPAALKYRFPTPRSVASSTRRWCTRW